MSLLPRPLAHGLPAILGTVVCLALVACTSTPHDTTVIGSAKSDQKIPEAIPEVFDGSGQAETVYNAVVQAKMDAVHKMVLALVGKDIEEKNYEKLQSIVCDPNNPNKFVYNDTLVILSRESIGSLTDPRFAVDISIKPNRLAITQSIRAMGLPLLVSETTSTLPPADQTPGRLCFLVYFGDQKSQEDTFAHNAAIAQADSILVNKGYTIIDPAQVEKYAKDGEKIWQEQTGGQIPRIQWIAQRLNATVYVEIDSSTSTQTHGRNYYAHAAISIKMYEASSGELLASQKFSSPETLSKVDETDAVFNALQSTIYTAFPEIIAQSEPILAQRFAAIVRH